MKFSICIPQFNRIDYLLKSLDELQGQNFSNFEVVISDDCSTDDTTIRIQEYRASSKFPITYFKFDANEGYDRNLRKSLELASGDYCFVLGNDDTLSHSKVLMDLEKFLIENNLPDLGYCNYKEYSNHNIVTSRALKTDIIGTGPEIGLRHYSCFSFVAGLIFKKSTFDKFNSDKFDKSIYAQIALALNMICNGAILFSIDEIWVKKDITIGQNEKSNSYLDFINKSYLKIKPSDGGLKSVIKVLTTVLSENNQLLPKYKNYIFSKILFSTYPYWILDYKKNKATPAAIGLYLGLIPHRIHEFSSMTFRQRMKFSVGFQLVSLFAFLLPSFIFFKYKEQIYSWVKKTF
jgi:glycosyltransferase involved in cell wall biosynthesis